MGDAEQDLLAAAVRLWDMLSETVESGRLTVSDIPVDYHALVHQMTQCVGAFGRLTGDDWRPSWECSDSFPRYYACQDCDMTYSDTAKLGWIKNLNERVAPGETMPAGECPECGALVSIV